MTIYHRIGHNPVLDYTVDRDLLCKVDNVEQQGSNSKDVLAFNMWGVSLKKPTGLRRRSLRMQKNSNPAPLSLNLLRIPQGELVSLKRMSLENHYVAIWAVVC